MSMLAGKELLVGYREPFFSNINFVIERGLVVVLGPNGIGKSTFIKTLAGMETSLGGKVVLNHLELGDYTPSELAKQRSVLLTEPLGTRFFSVEDFVGMARYSYSDWKNTLTKTDHEKIERAIDATSIRHLQKKKLTFLSDGELQRVKIAHMLAQDAPLMLLDEPTSHLDIYHKVETLKLLKKISAEQNKIVLFSSHEIDICLQLADYLFLLYEGKCELNSSQDVVNSELFQSFMSKNNVIFDPETRQIYYRI